MSPEGHSPAVERALLSAELRKLRTDNGKTQEVVAAACEWSVAKFSRIENGTASIRKADLESLLRYYDVPGDHIDTLTRRARDARAPGWWEEYEFGTDKGFEAYVGYEDGASLIRMWQPLIVPGLIQTAEYAQATMKAWGVPQEAIEQKAKLRKERQEKVAARQPEQIYLLDEAVIRRPVGTAMPGQLRHLLLMAEKPYVTIRIIPFSRGPHFGLRGPFVLLGFAGPLENVLYLESSRRGDLLIADMKDQYAGPNVPKAENPSAEVATYEDAYNDLLKLSWEADESLAFISEQANNPALATHWDL